MLLDLKLKIIKGLKQINNLNSAPISWEVSLRASLEGKVGRFIYA